MYIVSFKANYSPWLKFSFGEYRYWISGVEASFINTRENISKDYYVAI